MQDIVWKTMILLNFVDAKPFFKDYINIKRLKGAASMNFYIINYFI